MKKFLLLSALLATQLMPAREMNAQNVASPRPVSTARSLQDSIIRAARRQLGRPYVFGGTSPSSGFDCSGLVQYILAAFHEKAPRNAASQANLGRAVARDVRQLRVGDLLTFGYGSRVSHIGIYIGNGRFIHASSGRHTVVEALLDRPAGRRVKPWIGARRLAFALPESTSTLVKESRIGPPR